MVSRWFRADFGRFRASFALISQGFAPVSRVILRGFALVSRAVSREPRECCTGFADSYAFSRGFERFRWLRAVSPTCISTAWYREVSRGIALLSRGIAGRSHTVLYSCTVQIRPATNGDQFVRPRHIPQAVPQQQASGCGMDTRIHLDTCI
jgi:hypothetical protein